MRDDFKIFISPHPRSMADIFADEDLAALRSLGEVILHVDPDLSDADFDGLAVDADVMIGTFDMSADRLARCRRLRAFINSEGNFGANIDYDYCFRHGIRVMSASHVFAEPVAEIGLGMAIDLGRGISRSDRLMREGRESYGFEANRNAKRLFHAQVGMIGFGDIARALLPLLKPFQVAVTVYDPWVPDLVIRQAGCHAGSLEDVLSSSMFIFVLAGVTTDNQHFLGEAQFALMPPGAIVLLLSRAAVVDFPAMMAAAASGRIQVATDVFPIEPVPAGDPVRGIESLLLSPHQAGALDQTLKQMGKCFAADIALIARDLPPIVCRVAQPETAARMRSMPVARS